MQLDSNAVIEFLKEVDKDLNRSITLVAVGGTAMTLLRVKPSTVDVDFILPGADYAEFQNALRNTPHGFTIHSWRDGIVFSQILPDDYLKRARDIRRMKRIRLKALHPVDIVVTKIGRLDDRDKQDIRACISKFKLTKTAVARRAKKVDYVGREENYKLNLKYVLDNFFD
jgi:hypothetical protein